MMKRMKHRADEKDLQAPFTFARSYVRSSTYLNYRHEMWPYPPVLLLWNHEPRNLLYAFSRSAAFVHWKLIIQFRGHTIIPAHAPPQTTNIEIGEDHC